MRRANITECPYMALFTTILLQLLSRAFQATESSVYQQKFTIKVQTLYFQNLTNFVNHQ